MLLLSCYFWYILHITHHYTHTSNLLPCPVHQTPYPFIFLLCSYLHINTFFASIVILSFTLYQLSFTLWQYQSSSCVLIRPSKVQQISVAYYLPPPLTTHQYRLYTTSSSYCSNLFHRVLLSIYFRSLHIPQLYTLNGCCYWQSSDGEEGGGAMYLVTLHTEEARGRRGKITFSCSLAQLTHLVTRLRQASRCVQKYASNSWLFLSVRMYFNFPCCSDSTTVGANFLCLLLLAHIFLPWFMTYRRPSKISLFFCGDCEPSQVSEHKGSVRDGSTCTPSLLEEDW